MNAIHQIITNTNPGEYYESDGPDVQLPEVLPAKLVAFYLPQFHPIKENDEWWGKGFTEWTNVTKAVPRFEGHYQPRLPGELGFYDLRMDGVLSRQAALARRHGIDGFCFHHYWFNGRRVLEGPLNFLLSRPDIDIGFCVNWANEPWSRRWDGHNTDVLLKQEHSIEDSIAFAKSLEPLFRDPRYIRVNGRPLLMLYRPGIVPEARATVQAWRDHFKSVGLGDPYIVMPQAFSDGDPRKYGMDAAVGFPPFWAGWDAPRIQDELDRLDPDHACEVVDYNVMADRMVGEHPADFILHPGVCPSWDNDARRQGKGFCFHGSTPASYGKWLQRACQNAISANPSGERLVFINAWNEWAEGAYLEPDRHYGYAYLRETARTLKRLALGAGAGESPIPRAAVGAAENAPGVSDRTLLTKASHKVANTLEAIARRLR